MCHICFAFYMGFANQARSKICCNLYSISIKLRIRRKKEKIRACTEDIKADMIYCWVAKFQTENIIRLNTSWQFHTERTVQQSVCPLFFTTWAEVRRTLDASWDEHASPSDDEREEQKMWRTRGLYGFVFQGSISSRIGLQGATSSPNYRMRIVNYVLLYVKTLFTAIMLCRNVFLSPKPGVSIGNFLDMRSICDKQLPSYSPCAHKEQTGVGRVWEVLLPPLPPLLDMLALPLRCTRESLSKTFTLLATIISTALQRASATIRSLLVLLLAMMGSNVSLRVSFSRHGKNSSPPGWVFLYSCSEDPRGFRNALISLQ